LIWIKATDGRRQIGGFRLVGGIVGLENGEMY
jgi:hypothetical protein